MDDVPFIWMFLRNLTFSWLFLTASLIVFTVSWLGAWRTFKNRKEKP